MPSFACQACSRPFDVPEATLAKFPGWQPKTCLACKNKAQVGKGAGGAARGRTSAGVSRGGGGRSASSREENLTCAQVLERYTAGPTDGVFTDGAADPNPGPGGWGAVYVTGNNVVKESCGSEPHTTNNRMELMALIAGCKLVPEGITAVMYTDSELCVKTINEWAAAWKPAGGSAKLGRSRIWNWCRSSMRLCSAAKSCRCAGSPRTRETAGMSTPTRWPRRTGAAYGERT